MTRRARVYLMISATRHLVMGVFTIAAAGEFTNPTFVPVLAYLPVTGWGVLMLATAAVCGVAAVLRSATWARTALTVSATLSLTLGAGIFLGVLAVRISGGMAPIAAICLLSLAAKDYVVCAQPMRSPFEQVMRRMVSLGHR